jgi:hypothetical protein
LLNNSLCNPGEGETAIMEQVLHGNHFGKVAEQGNAVIGALIG